MHSGEDYIKLVGTVEGVIYRNDMNDYSVIELSSDGETNIAVGEIPSVAEGEILELLGEWTTHREFGKQFAFVSYEKRLPDGIEGIMRYLSSRYIKGVGPVTALKIVNKYGADSFDVIENHPEWLTDIPGITRKKALAISESFREQAELRRAMMFFGDFIASSDVGKIYKKFGADSVGVVSKNPYILCEGDFSVSFERVDKIASSLGFKPDAVERVLAGLKYVLKYNANMNGHTCLPKEKIILAAAELLGIEKSTVASRLSELLRIGELSSYLDGERELVMTCETDQMEGYVALRLRDMINRAPSLSAVDIASLIQMAEVGSNIRYADMQRLALFRCLSTGVTVITGGPGTGKTTIIKALISIFSNLGQRTVLCAPTGRAAKRMSEATAEEAKTIHRLLQTERDLNGETFFGRNINNPLEEDVVIVDEASMIDLSLMYALLRGIKRGGRLIIIGDADQLPSVGAGNVLGDIIASGAVDTIRLSEVFRQSDESRIIINAHNINNGIAPELAATRGDFFFVRRDNEREIAETVANLVTERLPRAYGEEIRDQIQLITPSRKGQGGVEILNKELQARINPPGQFKKEKQSLGVVFREGDKVMQTANNYDLEWKRGRYEGRGIFNGDIGIIESINLKGEAMTICFDDRTVEYPFSNLEELDLAYAITVHKSQGSEYPVVIIPMYNCAPMLMTRNLLYTAVTRAKKMVVMVGLPDVPSRMVANNREILRYTLLHKRLENAE